MRSHKTTQQLVAVILLLLLSVGCGAPAVAPGAVAASSKERVLSPEAPRDDLRALAAGNNAFAFDLYQAMPDEGENFLYSPYSLSVALAMVYAGARGQTEQQMADTLHFELPQERLHPAFNALGLELDSRSHGATQEASGENVEKSGFELNIANAVWGQAGYSFLPEYLDLLALNYGAGVRLVDFQADPLAAVDAINQWVSEETEGRIRDILDRLGRDTILVLANAIYFDAAWALPFDEADTRDEPFYLLDGEEEKVPLMHQRSDFSYTEGDGYQAIQLPYENGNVAMVILLPREGRFREIEERLTGGWVQSVVSGFSAHDVILTMPKFSFETPVLNLAATLEAMGMPDAFSKRDADFSAVAQLQPDEVIYISQVLHKAFIEVDEKATEAAAAVVVEVEIEVGLVIGAPTVPPPIIMNIRRPFIFLIRDIKTNTILFVGRVVDPTQ
jgi:serpin B